MADRGAIDQIPAAMKRQTTISRWRSWKGAALCFEGARLRRPPADEVAARISSTKGRIYHITLQAELFLDVYRPVWK